MNAARITVDPSPAPWRYDKFENCLRDAAGQEVARFPSHRRYPIDEANAEAIVEAVNARAAAERKKAMGVGDRALQAGEMR